MTSAAISSLCPVSPSLAFLASAPFSGAMNEQSKASLGRGHREDDDDDDEGRDDGDGDVPRGGGVGVI